MSTVEIKQSIKRLIAAGNRGCTLRKKTKLSVILNYHSIHPLHDYSTKPGDFAEQMAYLANEFQVLSLPDFHRARVNGTELADRIAMVTFDDGYEDNYEYALPVLDKFEIPATIFLTTGFIDKELDITQEHVAYRGLKPLTWEHVTQMKQSRISFGAHTHTHRMLTKIPPKEAEEEIAKNKEILEKRLMEPVYMFAYPFGWRRSFDDRKKSTLIAYGFRLACSTIWGSDNSDTDIFALHRVRIDAVDTAYDFKQKVNGCWDFVKLFQVAK